MSERTYHHGNLRVALLECAENTVRERGVQALSLRELARDVGVSHGAPRRHFSDRQALLDALAENGFNRLEQALLEAVDAAGAGLRPQLLSIAQAYVDFATRHAALLELMFAGKHREGADATHAAAERALAIPLSTIVEAQRAGEVIKVDPERLNQVAFATLHGLATMANGGMMPGHDIDLVVTDAVDGLLSGMLPR